MADRKNALLKELNKLSKEINEEGLEFLVNQAKIILHNMQINKVNEELRKLEKIDEEIKNAKTDRDSAAGVEVETDKRAVAVEEAGNNFILVLGSSRKFLNLKEMRKVVHICQSAANGSSSGNAETEAALRLYRWFKANRTDVLADGRIGNAHNPKIKELFRIITAKYRTKD